LYHPVISGGRALDHDFRALEARRGRSDLVVRRHRANDARV